jgi:hypothetical protein
LQDNRKEQNQRQNQNPQRALKQLAGQVPTVNIISDRAAVAL